MNPVTMEEEYSKELLILEAGTLMNEFIMSWPDLVVDTISQTAIRAHEYGDGKIQEGEMDYHLTVGSPLAGIAKQVKLTFKISQGKLMAPTHGETPLGQQVKLSPNTFSNFVRLGIMDG